MIVADSSYIIEGLLRNADLLEAEDLVAPDLALYEVTNILWKHESKLRDIRDAGPYLDSFHELLSSKAIQLLRPDEALLKKTYRIALEEKITVYDAVFVALAIDLNTEFRTYDKEQLRALSHRRKKTP